VKLHVETYGEGRPLVLLHGGGSTAQTTWGALIPHLARAHRVIAPEQRGHGHTPDPDEPWRFEQMADDTAAVLDGLGVEHADVIGFSMGGRLALELTVRHPARVRRLVVCSGFFAFGGLMRELREGFAHASPDNMPPMLREAYLAANPAPDLARFVAKSVALMTGGRDVSAQELEAIASPVLVMQGDQDVITVEHAAAFARAVPHGQLAVLPGCTHGAYLGVAESGGAGFDLALAMIERFL
jgi:pimeloyl-ACP methyl ester carboxylesterase